METYKILIISDNPFDNEEEKKEFLKDLSIEFEIKEFKEKEIEDSFNYMKGYKCLDTFIILSEGIKFEFLNEIKNNIKDLIIIPRIFILSKNETDIVLHKTFYNYGEGSILQIKKYILSLIEKRNEMKKKLHEIEKNKNKNDEIEQKKSYSFEYSIDIEKLKLIYDLLLNRDTITDEQITKYNEELFEELYDSYYATTIDLYQIVEISKIPIELLSKFYIKFYANGQDFIKDLRKSLTTVGPLDSKFYKYIKILYLANKLDVFEDTSCNVLYHSAKIEEYEIEKIKDIISNEKEPIIYARKFLSFSESERIVERFKAIEKYNTKITLKINNKNGLKTYAKIDEISPCQESEILFFPFTAFKIISFKDFKVNKNGVNKNEYEIELEYLDIINDLTKNKRSSYLCICF
jgi:hypothetical protein